jgi:hypothetical protein
MGRTRRGAGVCRVLVARMAMTARGFHRLLRAIFRCDHAHMRREVDAGKLYLVCDCGHRVEALPQTPAERKKAKRLADQVTAQKRPATVLPMRTRAQR